VFSELFLIAGQYPDPLSRRQMHLKQTPGESRGGGVARKLMQRKNIRLLHARIFCLRF
jgi:hypothetical protein